MDQEAVGTSRHEEGHGVRGQCAQGGRHLRGRRACSWKTSSHTATSSGEIVVLSDYDIGVCRGCKSCTNRGEERCPLKDDRDVLIEKMMASDGVVFASPNYSFQVSAIMKIFLDRLAFLFHRPRFHGKTFTGIVVQAIGMGRQDREVPRVRRRRPGLQRREGQLHPGRSSR